LETLPAERCFIPADHYLLLKDNVPFVPDPLRYGGDKRESNMAFWECLLKEHKASYTVIDAKKWGDRFQQARDACEVVFKSNPLWGYRRR